MRNLARKLQKMQTGGKSSAKLVKSKIKSAKSAKSKPKPKASKGSGSVYVNPDNVDVDKPFRGGAKLKWSDAEGAGEKPVRRPRPNSRSPSLRKSPISKVKVDGRS